MSHRLVLSDAWWAVVARLPEAGMGYTYGRITLRDGRVYTPVTIDGRALIAGPWGHAIPFTEADIATIESA